MNDREQRLLQRTREVLQRQVDNMPADVGRQLQQARNQALAELSSSQTSAFYGGVRGLAVALLVLAVGVSIWFTMTADKLAVFSPDNDNLLMVQDQSLSPEEIELLDNLEFYQWLAQHKQQG
jgi:hypothetical protein